MLSDSRSAPRATVLTYLLIGLWAAIYAWRTVVGHWSFATNGYDLSVFDHAMWSVAHGGAGFVPFIGQSILSHHFMPILWVLVPVYAVAPGPLTLLLLQVFATAAAAVILFRIQRDRGLAPWTACGLTLVFLLCRRTHSAVAGTFYPECLQAPLTFAMVWLWRDGRWPLWLAVLLLLMTKEDAALYVAGFAAVAWWLRDGPRRRAVVLGALAVVWLAGAVLVAIPASRAADGLSRSNPLIESRYGSSLDGRVDPAELARRVASPKSAGTAAEILVSAGLLPLAAMSWLVPAGAGVIANLAAAPGTMQSALVGHYAWPVLAWVFLSASFGAIRVERRSPVAATIWIGALLIVSAAGNPALQRIGSTALTPDARQVQAQLVEIGRAPVMLVQPNLMPHLPQMPQVFAIDGLPPPREPDLVLLTTVGDLWPLTPEEVRARVDAYRQNPSYQEVASGPLFAFRHR